jgi:hypothetical protein
MNAEVPQTARTLIGLNLRRRRVDEGRRPSSPPYRLRRALDHAGQNAAASDAPPDSRLPARLDEGEAPGLRVDLLSSGEVGSAVADGTEADPTPLSSRAHRYTHSRNR